MHTSAEGTHAIVASRHQPDAAATRSAVFANWPRGTVLHLAIVHTATHPGPARGALGRSACVRGDHSRATADYRGVPRESASGVSTRMSSADQIIALATSGAPRLPNAEALRLLVLARSAQEVLDDADASCVEQLVAASVLTYVALAIDYETGARAALSASRQAFKVEAARSFSLLGTLPHPGVHALFIEGLANKYSQAEALDHLCELGANDVENTRAHFERLRAESETLRYELVAAVRTFFGGRRKLMRLLPRESAA